MNIIKADLKDLLKQLFVRHKIKSLEPEIRSQGIVYDKDGNIKTQKEA